MSSVSGAVAVVGGKAVDRIAQRDDPRFARDGRARLAVGITRAVEPLVVVVDDRRESPSTANAREHPVAEHAVPDRTTARHLLFAVELEHANVVQQRREVQAREILVTEAHAANEPVRELRHALAVPAGGTQRGIERGDQDIGDV